MRLYHSRLLALALAATLAAGPTFAADAAADTSLALVPADAAFYGASLKLGDQWDRFVQSNAFAKLKALPVVQAGLERLRDEAGKPDTPIGHISAVLKDPANQELVDLLRDAVRQEFFVYGGANWGQVIPVLQELQGAQYFGRLGAVFSGQLARADQTKAQARAMLEALNEARDKLQVPEFVIGFRTTKKGAATSQIKRLEDLLTHVAEQHPGLKGRVKRVTAGGADGLTLSLDGSMVPWDSIPFEEIEETKGEFKDLVAKLKTLTLSVSLAVKRDYLLVSIGPSSEGIGRFGNGPALATRSEFKPLSKVADKDLLGVGYISKAFATAVATSPEDIGHMADVGKDWLAKAPISKKRREAIEKDLKQLAKEIAAALPAPAARFSCTVRTPRGQETTTYEYGPAPKVPPGPLTVLDHVGGSPLVVIAGHTGEPVAKYRTFVHWLQVFYGHTAGIYGEMFGGEDNKLQAVMQIVQPFLKRFDEITGSQTLPALGAGTDALVIDAKWTSKNWFPGLDQDGADLPMLELGCVRTVKDSAKFLEALQAYRTLVNDALVKARDTGVPIPPDANVPLAKSQNVGPGTAYHWPILSAGPDGVVQPNLGLSDQIVAVSLSLKHTERLLKPTPLPSQNRPLAQRSVFSTVHVNIAGLIGVARPWIERFVIPRAVANVPPDAPKGLTASEIPGQVKTVLDVMQCLRGVRSISFRDGDANVTRTETIIRDL
jgi:hypothetical protein